MSKGKKGTLAERLRAEELQRNPTISAGEEDARGPKPAPPTPQDVPDDQVDHKGAAGSDADPIPDPKAEAEEAGLTTEAPVPEPDPPESGKGGAWDPMTEDPPKVTERREKPQVDKKKIKHVRGPAPGDRITY